MEGCLFKGGRLIKGESYKVFLSTNCNQILEKSFLKLKTQSNHYNIIHINNKHSLKQESPRKHTVVPLSTLH